MDVPVLEVYPPPGDVLMISTPGAAMSGLGSDKPVNPCPEKGASVSLLLLYAATVMGRDAVDGMVSVVSSEGTRKPVSGLMVLEEGSQRL